MSARTELQTVRDLLACTSGPAWSGDWQDAMKHAIAIIDERLRTMSAEALYIVVDDVSVVGVYSTLSQAAVAMSLVDGSCVEERELDKLPDEPEPREPDYGAPSAAERLERDSFDADRGAR